MEGDSAAHVETVGVKGGKIIFTRTKIESEKLRGGSTEMIDLNGKPEVRL